MEMYFGMGWNDNGWLMEGGTKREGENKREKESGR
jgi:hypothetical protein